MILKVHNLILNASGDRSAFLFCIVKLNPISQRSHRWTRRQSQWNLLIFAKGDSMISVVKVHQIRSSSRGGPWERAFLKSLLSPSGRHRMQLWDLSWPWNGSYLEFGFMWPARGASRLSSKGLHRRTHKKQTHLSHCKEQIPHSRKFSSLRKGSLILLELLVCVCTSIRTCAKLYPIPSWATYEGTKAPKHSKPWCPDTHSFCTVIQYLTKAPCFTRTHPFMSTRGEEPGWNSVFNIWKTIHYNGRTKIAHQKMRSESGSSSGEPVQLMHIFFFRWKGCHSISTFEKWFWTLTIGTQI